MIFMNPHSEAVLMFLACPVAWSGEWSKTLLLGQDPEYACLPTGL